MTYDENIKRAEAIIAQLEASEALSMEEYKRLSSEATALLRACKADIDALAQDLTDSVKSGDRNIR